MKERVWSLLQMYTVQQTEKQYTGAEQTLPTEA